jgi:preprotein translocase subunit SecD
MRKLRSAAVLLAVAAGLASCSSGGDEQANRPCEGPGTGGPRVVYRPEPTPDAPRVTPVGIEQTIEVMCRRSRALGAHGARIREVSGDRIVVRLGPGAASLQAATALGIPARLAFYDWDSNVIGSPDRPLPDLLRAVRRAESERPRAEPEDVPAAGAERQTVERYKGDQRRIDAFYDRRNDASGPSYYAEAGGKIVAGPETSCAGLAVALAPTGRDPKGASVAGDLDAAACGRRLTGRGLPAGGAVHVVPRGIRVIAAARPGGGAAGDELTGLAGTPSERTAGYFVLEDDAGLLSDAVDGADERKDQATGRSGVRVQFTEKGREQFRVLTQSIVVHGLQRPIGGGDPRLAATLDDQLVSLVAIDPTTSAQGLDPTQGAVIADLGDATRARVVAKLLDAGALPLDVRPAP